MNEPGGYEWLQGEGAHEFLFIDERTHPTLQEWNFQRADQTKAKVQNLVRPQLHARMSARTHTQYTHTRAVTPILWP